MKIAVFSAHNFEKEVFLQHHGSHEFLWLNVQLTEATAVMAAGCKAVCVFVNDDGSEQVLNKLKKIGVEFVLLRSAGYNHVDFKSALQLGMRAARVPEYSPHAVAEHTVALMLAL